MNILYNSSYFISEFKTHIENNDTIPINFFNDHQKKILAQLFSNSPDKYIEKYQSLKKNDAYNNLENIINISQQETKELLKIDINNFEQNKVFYSQKNIQISPVFKASIKKIKKILGREKLNTDLIKFPEVANYSMIHERRKATKTRSNEC